MHSRERARATLILVLSQPASRIPGRQRAVRFQRWQRHTPKTALAVNQDALVIAEIAELVRLDSVLLGLGVVDVAPACAETPRAFDHALLANEISGLNCVGFVGSPEDQAVAEI